MNTHKYVLDLQKHMAKSIIGQAHVIERLLIGLLANGNLLVEGLPGLAKTRAIKALSTNLEADFSRIQFTPDLLPSDVTGTEVYYSSDSGSEFRFSPGPIFANLVLADEINRAPAKVQAALLEAMEERQVTVSGTTHQLPPLFMVMATQNPIEQEGTYPLPEAQMDRFLMHVQITYPPVEDEVEIIRLIRREDRPKETSEVSNEDSSSSRLSQDVIFDARKEIATVHVSEEIDRYMADVVYATRTPEKYEDELASWIEVGSSPRASLSLDRCARVQAWLKGKDYVAPDDVQAVAHDVLRHRMILSYTARGSGIDTNSVVDRIVELVAV